jgi:prophage regulatory protein
MYKPKFLREPELLTIVPFSKPTLHRKVKDQSFPAPVKIGVRANAWLREEVEAWEQSIIAKRDARLAAQADHNA